MVVAIFSTTASAQGTSKRLLSAVMIVGGVTVIKIDIGKMS